MINTSPKFHFLKFLKLVKQSRNTLLEVYQNLKITPYLHK